MAVENDIITLENERLLNLLSIYLNDAPQSIGPEDIAALSEFDIPQEEAFSLTLAGLLGLDIVENESDKLFYDSYFPLMIHRQDPQTYYSNPYFSNIKLPQEKIGNAEFTSESLMPFEGFVVNDFESMDDGRIIPQLGYFDEEYTYPALLDNGRPWMTLMPNEINSQQDGIDEARGNVLTFGLGLGYFAYMTSMKPQVKTVTVVDSNPNIIELFEEQLLPQFEHREKIRVICSDAFDYAEHELAKSDVDFVYTDLWHDVGDGLDLYLKMREYEKKKPDAVFMYWIEKTMLCYL
jgi:hypothetical protein